MSAPDRSSRFIGNSTPDRGGRVSPDAVQIAEHLFAFVQITARRGLEGDVMAAMQHHLGLDLPRAGRVALSGDIAAIWIKPNGWLLRAPALKERSFIGGVSSALAESAAVVDQSHGRAVLRISGVHAREVLQKCCRLDFHPSVFAAGQSASTVIAHVFCTIHQLDDGPTYELIVGSTYAAWLLEELTQAAAAFGWRFTRAANETSE